MENRIVASTSIRSCDRKSDGDDEKANPEVIRLHRAALEVIKAKKHERPLLSNGIVKAKDCKGTKPAAPV